MQKIGTRLMERAKEIFVRREDWHVGIVRRPITYFLSNRGMPEIWWLPRPRTGKFLADPFGVQKDDRLFIFCEEFDHRMWRGKIVCLEFSHESGFSLPREVLDLPIHTSYPYVLEHDGGIYCVPETSQAREISLYNALVFPDTWVKVATLIRDFAGLDATVFQWEDRWWLACTDHEVGPFNNLCLWHASSLFGPWKPHPRNPVKNDVASSRPAGTPFVHDGQLYRPAQDCSSTYGGRVVINKVVSLTTTDFVEERAAMVEPNHAGPYPHGVHTLSAVDGLTLVDGKRLGLLPRLRLSKVFR